MRSPGISYQGGSCAAAEGEQVVDFLHRPRQAIWLDILGFHGRNDLNDNNKRRRIVGERSRFTSPGRSGQSDNDQRPDGREQNEGADPPLRCAFQEEMRQQVFGDDPAPYPISALRAGKAPDKQCRRQQRDEPPWPQEMEIANHRENIRDTAVSGMRAAWVGKTSLGGHGGGQVME